jgi:hypothetical protein
VFAPFSGVSGWMDARVEVCRCAVAGISMARDECDVVVVVPVIREVCFVKTAGRLAH